jgi:hypothetical protein
MSLRISEEAFLTYCTRQSVELGKDIVFCWVSQYTKADAASPVKLAFHAMMIGDKIAYTLGISKEVQHIVRLN